MRYTLAVNAGSSSLKMALFSATDGNVPELVHSMAVENIGEPTATLTTQATRQHDVTTNVKVENHSAAVALLIDTFSRQYNPNAISSVGHRIVHGGGVFTDPEIVTSEVVQRLKTLVELDPDHMPASLACLAAAKRHLPAAKHIVCFDTAFYEEMPLIAQRLPLPRKYHKEGLRRYGFHGLSYQYLLHDFASHEGKTAARGRIIFAHMGSGVSLTVTINGTPVDTTMGFTPASGVMMSSRSGDLDPGVVAYLQRRYGMNAEEFNHMVNQEAGLLGVSGMSADMHILLDARKKNESAAEAIDLFCYTIAKAIGALATTVGGVDSLIFSGGIGERSAVIRSQICQNLSFLGIELDPERNQTNDRLISRYGAKVGVHVIPTNEALLIATQTVHLIQGGDPHGHDK